MRPKARGLAQHGGPPGWLEESDSAGVILYVIGRAVPLRPKVIGMAQHGGPPSWLEESDPSSVILYVMDGANRLSFPN